MIMKKYYVKNVNFLAYIRKNDYLCIRKLRGRGKTLKYSLQLTFFLIVKIC